MDKTQKFPKKVDEPMSSFVIERAGELKEFMESAGVILSDGEGGHYYYLPHWVRFEESPEGVDAFFYPLDKLPENIKNLIKSMRDG